MYLVSKLLDKNSMNIVIKSDISNAIYLSNEGFMLSTLLAENLMDKIEHTQTSTYPGFY